MGRLSFLTGLLAAFAVAPVAAASCAPTSLVHIVAHDTSPNLDPQSYAAQPKITFRIGSDRLRVEETADPVLRIQSVFVVAEPNAWMANLYNMRGRRLIDPGPTFETRAPVIALPGASAKAQSLELGCENDFIQSNAPHPVRSERVDGRDYDVYRVEGGSDAVEVLEAPGSSSPAFVRYYRREKLIFAIQYDLYRVGGRYDPTLFEPLPGVHYESAPGAGGAR